MSLVITAVLLAIYCAIAWRDFRLAVFLFLAALPTYLLRLEIFGLPTTVLELMFGILTIGWLIKLLKEKTKLSFVKPWLWPITLLLIAGIVGVMVAPDKMAALGVFKAYLLEPIIFFFVLYTTLKQTNDTEEALSFLGLGALAVALFAIYQRFTGQAIPIPWDIEQRVTSVFPYPNAVGLYLGPIIILGACALWRSFRTKIYPRVWFWLLIVGASMAATVFSRTEAAWTALAVTLVLTGLFIKRWRRPTLVILTLVIVLIILTPTVHSKLLLQDYSGAVRLKQWEESINMLKDNWLFGAGLSGYPIALQPYHMRQEIEIFQYPHNLVLNIWSELGVLGLIAAGWLAILSIKTFRRARKNQPPLNWLAFAATAALLEMTIHGLVDVPFFKNDLAMLTAATLTLLLWSTAKEGLTTPKTSA